MWLKAVSSAPQNEAPNQTDATSASTPVFVVEIRTCFSSVASVVFVAPGKISLRSRSTLCSTDPLFSTWPAMNSPSSATGTTVSSIA